MRKLQDLVHGLHTFESVTFRRHEELFRRLAAEQKPEVLFVACSDSRTSPELITGAGPGEVFILRNAGACVPVYGEQGDGWGEAGTIEYAVEALGVRHVVVCGHSRCGAVHGMLHPEEVAELPAVARWLEHGAPTRELLRRHYAHLEGDALWEVGVEEHVLRQVENLMTHPSVARRVAAGELAVYAWIYDVSSGQTLQFDPDEDAFVRCERAEPAR